MAANDYAVVIGINRYRETEISQLRAPARDAIRFIRWLIDPDGGDLPRDHVYPFLSPTPPNSTWVKPPSVTEVMKTLEQFVMDGEAAYMEGRPLGRRLYLFLAGHGIEAFPTHKYVALLMAEANLRFFASKHIPGLAFARDLQLSGYFEEIVLFMDTCRSEASLRGMMPLFNVEARILDPEPLKFFALAARWGHKAREVPTVGKKRRWVGRFSTYLLDGLQGGARAHDPDGAITGLSLRIYLKNRFDKLKSKTSVKLLKAISVPDYEADDHFVFAPGRSGGPPALPRVDVAVECEADMLPPFQLQSAELDEVVGLYKAAKPPLRINGLAPGLYHLVATDTGAKKIFEVHAGDVLDPLDGAMPGVTVGLYDPASGGIKVEDA